MPPTLSVAVIARNEAGNIRACLESVRFADEIVVVDGGSTDRTVEIAREFTAHVHIRTMEQGFGEFKNWAMDQTTGDWILVLDADEQVTEAGRREILSVIADPGDTVAFSFPRLTRFLGKNIRYSGWYDSAIIRLVRQDGGRHDSAWVHEVIEPRGPLRQLTEPLIHYTYRDVAHHMDKLQVYTTLNARDWYSAGIRIRTRNMPWYFFLKPLAIFFRKLILMQGWRDGFQGFVIAVMSAFQYFGSYVKLWQLQQQSPSIPVVFLHETARVAGAENSLFHLASGLSAPFAPAVILAEDGLLAERFRERKIPLVVQPMPGIRNPLSLIMAIYRIIKQLRKLKAEIVHGNSPRTNLYAALAGIFSGCRVIFHARNLLTVERIDPDRLLSPLASAILCNSDAIRRRFPGNQRAFTVINGVDLKRFDPGQYSQSQVRQAFALPENVPVIGITSRFGPDKGHETLIMAAARLMKQGLDFRMLIVGDAVFEADRDREAMLQKMVEDNGLNDRVKFTGYTQNVPEMLSVMDVFVLAAHQEPCGRVLFEAQAMELPVVGTDTGGTPEIIEDHVTGLLVPPRDAEKLAAALQTLLDNPVLRQRMGKAGRQRMKQLFPVQRNIRHTEKIYRTLLRNQ